MTHMTATSISVFLTSLALRVVREILAHGGRGVVKEQTLRVMTCREDERKNQKELRKISGNKTLKHDEANRKEGIGLSLLLVAPSQLRGFMVDFLSWCCLLIDIKMTSMSMLHFLSSPPPLILLFFNSPCLTDVDCHLHRLRHARNGIRTSHLSSSCDDQQLLPVRTILLVKPRSVFCICWNSTGFCVSLSYFMALSCVVEKLPLPNAAIPQECDTGSHGCKQRDVMSGVDGD